MRLERFKNDDSAVSPVIGVILMVAITVILAAVIASFVLGLSPGTSTTPTATFSAETGNPGSPVLNVTMDSGETIETQNLKFVGPVSANPSSLSNVTNAGTMKSDAPSELSAGSEIVVGVNSTGVEVDLVYTNGDTSSTMQTFEVE